MWPRVVELMLGCWLVISPFVFRHPADATSFWATDMISGAAVILLALCSCWRRLRYAHLAILVAGGWLIGFGFFAASHPAPPALQNNVLVGLLLLMFAVIPGEASRPPEAWRRFEAS